MACSAVSSPRPTSPRFWAGFPAPHASRTSPQSISWSKPSSKISRSRRRVFARLDEVCRPDTILATNTSSYAVTDLAAATTRPERVVGLHYFFHPAKNRLVEVVAGQATNPIAYRRAWRLQEALGKTPIASSDSYGFIVNRFFLPWLTEAVRMLRRGWRDHGNDRRSREAGVRHRHGTVRVDECYGRADRASCSDDARPGVRADVRSTCASSHSSGIRAALEITGAIDSGQFRVVADRLSAAACYVAGALVDEGVGTIEDTDIGARVGLRWRRGPFELMNHYGIGRARDLVADFAARWKMPVPAIIDTPGAREHAVPLYARPLRDRRWHRDADDQSSGRDERAQRGRRVATRGGVSRRGRRTRRSTASSSRAAARRSSPAPISGSSCGTSRPAQSHSIAEFTRRGQALLRAFETCPKPVIARLQGLALGGGVELALACHQIIATPKATLAFPETGIGIYPGLGGTQRTTRRVGRGLAKWLVLTGQTVSAEEALAIGLVDAVVPYEQARCRHRSRDRQRPRDRSRSKSGSRRLSSDRRVLRSLRGR